MELACCLYKELTGVSVFQGFCLAEADTANRADGAVLSTPVREVIVVLLLQDVMRSSVVWFLVRHPAVVRKESWEI